MNRARGAQQHPETCESKGVPCDAEIPEDRTEFHLADDGRGFDIGEPHDGFGLVGMRERVNGMKGRFSLQSGPGQGTEIRIVLELGSS